MFRKNLAFLSLIISSVNIMPAQAEIITLPVLDQTQIDPVFDVLGATFIFRSMEPASHPTFFGVWLNARANGTVISALSSFVTTGYPLFPFANIQAGINGPAGLGLEFGFVPSLSLSGTSLSSFGGNLKFAFTQLFGPLFPISAAVKASYTSAGMNFTQTLGGVPMTVSYSTSIVGATLMVSKNLIFFEPYLGYGLMTRTSSLGAQGSTSLFGPSVTVAANTVTGSKLSGWLQAGFEIKLALIVLGAQYDNVFGTNTYSGKFGFKF